MYRFRANRSRSGFSLLELMVSLSIVLVLGALAWPALNFALASGKASRCSSNLRQIYTAALCWSNDNDGRIVPVYSPQDPNDPGALNNWTGFLAPYLGRGSTKNFTSAQDLPVAVCPVHPKKFGYGYNYFYLSWIFQTYAINQWATLARMTAPSRTVFIVDSYNAGNSSEVFSNWKPYVRCPSAAKSYTDALPSFRHPGNTANVLWLDGHVSAETATSDFWKDDKLWGNPNP